MSLGAWGGIVGIVAFAMAAWGAAPDRLPLSLRALMARMAMGQLFGTVGAVSSYLLFVYAIAQLRAQPFLGTVEDNLDLIIWGAPTSMLCGAIAGAVFKRE